MLSTEKSLLCKFVNCQVEALNFVKQSNEQALIANIYRGFNLQMTCDSAELSSKFMLFDWQHPYILQFYKGIDLDQFAPRYQFEVLRNLYSLRDKIDHDLQELEPVMDDYMLLLQAEDLDSAQIKAKLKAEQQILDFWLLYRKVVSVVGGFLMLEHFDDCLPIMIKKYHYCRKRYILSNKLSHINDKLLHFYNAEHELLASKIKQAKKLEVKADLIQSQIKQFDREILEIDQQLNNLRDFYANDSSFCMHEKYRDSALCLNYLHRAERKTLAAEIVTIKVDELAKENAQGIDFKSVLSELISGTKQIKQQSEIQSLYNLLADFVLATNCQVQSCLYSPFLLTVDGRKKFGMNLLRHRPKFILWQFVSSSIRAQSLHDEWCSFLHLLAEHEQITNCLLDDEYVENLSDFIKAKIDIVADSFVAFKFADAEHTLADEEHISNEPEELANDKNESHVNAGQEASTDEQNERTEQIGQAEQTAQTEKMMEQVRPKENSEKEVTLDVAVETNDSSSASKAVSTKMET